MHELRERQRCLNPAPVLLQEQVLMEPDRLPVAGASLQPQASTSRLVLSLIDGQKFVTTDDLGAAVEAGVMQTLDIMRRDQMTRSSMGLN